jgi:hypothetical protein
VGGVPFQVWKEPLNVVELKTVYGFSNSCYKYLPMMYHGKQLQPDEPFLFTAFNDEKITASLLAGFLMAYSNSFWLYFLSIKH